jgi:hypothetical protein
MEAMRLEPGPIGIWLATNNNRALPHPLDSLDIAPGIDGLREVSTRVSNRYQIRPLDCSRFS